MQSAVCNRCPLWARCCLNYGGKACHSAAKEAGFEVKPTNFEKIKDMSIGELALFIRTIRTDDFGQTVINNKVYINSNDICKWLESEGADDEQAD